MRPPAAPHRIATIVALLASLITLLACGASSTVAASATGTVTASRPTPTATSAAPPAHAFAWTQYDSHGVPQIWASLNGATPIQITHFTPPTGAGCPSWQLWSPPIFSPDLKHIVAALGSAQCGDGAWYGSVSIITVAGGAITDVPGTNYGMRISQRAAGWLDDTTIFYVNGGGAFTYALGAAAPTQLSGIANAEEAVARGTTLFYAAITYGPKVIPEAIHRYDLSTHAVMPGSISLGQYNACPCSPGDYPTLGWDVSPDGSHVVYQLATSGSPNGGFSVASSQVWYANADGSGATHIAQALTGTSFMRMQISPNGALVAITNTDPSGPVVTASVTSPGLPGDPNYHTYSPSALQFPVWKWDSSQFWAATQTSGPGAPIGNLYNYSVGGASVVGVTGGYNPWYTMGS